MVLDLGGKSVGIRNLNLPTNFVTQDARDSKHRSHRSFNTNELDDTVVRKSINMFANPHRETPKEQLLKYNREAYLTARGKETDRFTSIYSE